MSRALSVSSLSLSARGPRPWLPRLALLAALAASSGCADTMVTGPTSDLGSGAQDGHGAVDSGEDATAPKPVDAGDEDSALANMDAPSIDVPNTDLPDANLPDGTGPDGIAHDSDAPDAEDAEDADDTDDTEGPTLPLDVLTPPSDTTPPGPDTSAPDAGKIDTGATDTGATDTGATDTGATDTGATDTGTTDTGKTDTGATDTGATDTGTTDTGKTDTHTSDAGKTDTGGTDIGGTDASVADAGVSDSGTTLPDAGPDVGDDTTSDDTTSSDDTNGDASPDTAKPPLCPPIPPLAAPYANEVHTFRQGYKDYTGAVDLHLAVPAKTFHVPHPAATYPTDAEAPTFEWAVEATNGMGTHGLTSGAFSEGSADEVGLLQFKGVLGSERGQLPLRLKILNAQLRLRTASAKVPATVHRVLVPWDRNTRWESFGKASGVQLGDDAAPHYAWALKPKPGLNVIDVTSDVQAMTDGKAKNHGWMFLPTGTLTSVMVPWGALSKVKHIRVGLKMKTGRRGEVVVNLRHGSKQAILLNRIGRPNCFVNYGVAVPDLDIILDPKAPSSVHALNGSVSPLTGTFHPDTTCVNRPLCPANGTGLCGDQAAGRWWLTVRDEWARTTNGGEVQKAWLELTDVKGKTLTFNFPKIAFPDASEGDLSTVVHASDAANPALRPTLVVTAKAALRFDRPVSGAYPKSSGHVRVLLPKGATDKQDVYVVVTSTATTHAAPPLCAVKVPKGAPPEAVIPLSFGKPGLTKLTAHSKGLQPATLFVEVGDTTVKATPAFSRLAVGSAPRPFTVRVPLGVAGLVGPAGNELVVSVANPAVATVGGQASAKVQLNEAGAYTFTIQPGKVAGGSLITVTDTQGVLTPAYAWVTVTGVPHATQAWHTSPTLQLGPSGVPGQSATVSFQTTVTSRHTADHDTFLVNWRKVPNGAWQTLGAPKVSTVGSPGRLRHTFEIPRPKAGDKHEYLVTHLRNGKLQGAPRGGVVRGPPGKKWRMIAVSNVGIGGEAAESLDTEIASHKPDLLLNVGDVVYPHGEWEHWASRAFLPFTQTASSTVVAPAIGNHDVETDGGAPMAANYVLPTNGPPAPVPGLNYWFDYGHARFFVVNSVSAMPDPAWLVSGIQASPQDWNIVVTHELPVTRDPFKIDRQAKPTVREVLLAAAVKAGADLYIGGACHSWQRYLPVTGVVNTDAEVTTATCDAGPGVPLVYPGSAVWARDFGKPVPAKLKAPMQSYVPEVGTGVFDFDGDTLTVRMIDRDGVVRDTLVRKRCTKQKPCVCAP